MINKHNIIILWLKLIPNQHNIMILWLKLMILLDILYDSLSRAYNSPNKYYVSLNNNYDFS